DDGVEALGHGAIWLVRGAPLPPHDGDGNGCHNHWTIKHAQEQSPMSSIPRARQILRRTLPATILIAAAGAICASARAEYPERQITMIVCFPAGGGTDIAARLINTALGEALGKPVIVANLAVGVGNSGSAAAADAGGDGYTLLVCTSA